MNIINNLPTEISKLIGIFPQEQPVTPHFFSYTQESHWIGSEYNVNRRQNVNLSQTLVLKTYQEQPKIQLTCDTTAEHPVSWNELQEHSVHIIKEQT